MVTYAVMNEKGGVGKSTTAINVSACLAAYHRKIVLLIDLCPQGDAATGLGIDPSAFSGKLQPFSEVLFGREPDCRRCVLKTSIPNLLLIPGDERIAALGLDEPTALRAVLEQLPFQVDTLVIDTPPTKGPVFVNAVAAADLVLIPCQMKKFSVTNLARTLKTIRACQGYNPRVDWRAFFTHVDTRKTIALRNALEQTEPVRSRFFETQVRVCEDLNTAQEQGLSIFQFKPRSAGATDYFKLTAELLNHEGHTETDEAGDDQSRAVLNG